MRALAVVVLPVLVAGFVNADTQDRAQVSTTAAIATQSPYEEVPVSQAAGILRRG